MKEVREKKAVYIAGPITGVENYGEPFEEAEERLAAAGYIPLSPTRLPQGLTHEEYMQIDKTIIHIADAVLFLPGWSFSPGAVEEYRFCHGLGKPYGFAVGDIVEVLSI